MHIRSSPCFPSLEGPDCWLQSCELFKSGAVSVSVALLWSHARSLQALIDWVAVLGAGFPQRWDPIGCCHASRGSGGPALRQCWCLAGFLCSSPMTGLWLASCWAVLACLASKGQNLEIALEKHLLHEMIDAGTSRLLETLSPCFQTLSNPVAEEVQNNITPPCCHSSVTKVL